MAVDISHLFDPLNELDGLPGQGFIRREIEIEGAGGITVDTASGEAIIGFSESVKPIPKRSGGFSYKDPLTHMGFRVKRADDGEDPKVSVQTGYVQSTYYEDGWHFETFTVPTEIVDISAFPKYLYLKLPVKFNSGLDTDDGTFPEDTFISEAETIEGTPYFFYVGHSSGFMMRDRSVTPASYYSMESTIQSAETPAGTAEGTTNLTGYWKFLIAEITEDAIHQIHMGNFTMPQPFTFNIKSFEVV